MHKSIELIKNHKIALLLVLFGLLLRVLFVHYQGLSNDELSALLRCNFETLPELLLKGVKEGDMHPALYQILFWSWGKLFGESEFAIRSLSLLFFALNMGLIYLISLKFYSKNRGLLILTLYASLTFLIINTTFSRPYNSGTFGILFLFLSILNFHKDTKKYSLWIIGILVGFTITMYSHYFAFLTAGIIGFCSFFYLENTSKKLSFISIGCLAILLFLPHLYITKFQLNQGGLGWLAPPTLLWLKDFFILFFNNSRNLLLLILIALIVLFFVNWKKITFTKEEKFVIYIFSLSYLFAHIISLLYTPILRELVLQFLLPFLFLFLFKPFDFINKKVFSILTFSLLLFFTFHSIQSGNLFETKNFGVFREIGMKGNQYDKKYGFENIHYASSFNHVDYINYYRTNKLKENYLHWSKQETFYQFYERVKNTKTNYFVFQYSNAYFHPLYLELIKIFYPNVIEHNAYFNSSITLFSKIKNANSKLKKRKINVISDTTLLKNKSEFFGDSKIPASRLYEKLENNKGYFTIEARDFKSEDNSEVHFVLVAEKNGQMLKKNEQAVFYIALNQNRIETSNPKRKALLVFDLNSIQEKEFDLHFYCWNPSKKEVQFRTPNWYFVKEN